MEYSKLFSGFTDVRKSVLLIALLNYYVFVCCFAFAICFGIIYVLPHLSADSHSSYGTDKQKKFEQYLCIYGLFLIFPSYFNNKLKETTHTHEIKYIKRWLIFYLVFMVLTVVSFLLCFLDVSSSTFQLGFIIFIIIQAFQMCVVKCFYNAEKKFLTSSNSGLIMPTWNSPSDLTVNNQPVPLYANYARPLIIQESMHPPIHVTVYSQHSFDY